MKLPQGFINKYQELLGDEANNFFKSFDLPSLSAYRVNPNKMTKNQLNNIDDEPVPYCSTGFFGKVNGKSIQHTSGQVYSQEPSAMFVGEVVDAKPGEYILDLCAAPGGKSTHIAGKMANQGLLVSNEIFKNRAKILSENIERWGSSNTVVTNESPDKLESFFPAFFDKILVDAPCSGEGMFRKDPDAMQYWNESYSSECANRQRHILASAVKMLKPGGKLIYSTCTFAPEEDEQIINWLLDEYPQFEMTPINKYPGMDDGRNEWSKGSNDVSDAVRLFPHHIKGEGHFIARLSWKADSRNLDKKNYKLFKPSRLTKEQQTLLSEFLNDTMPNYSIRNVVLFGDRLYDMPDGMPSIDKLNITKPGIEVGTFKKNRFEPAIGLALSINSSEVKNTIQISQDQWRQYVHGDVIKVDTEHKKGWYLLTCNGYSICFGKLVNNTVKNFYPKGLRF
ncbi:RsmF rRNA methyltransferase first C-terminal domain-containing protein [Paucilactobacillus suebicus]|uniref:Fmu (Sun) domain-containing protein n=1 Tax=Paucilactobacillus suebicus DSM 5007 = KCTC 3549 TaxID=1423807 RepID=A0A0R1VUS8_9LACO|nr:RsmB/NOP family class I SAM-dependent RNA methyltransferase [Paucilactobacillus suebicus]KRM09418.1 Fmu (Sun) domain-containing protein [Paucilactobacillus suebicus DSM 5007 = KCTC 3549]